MFTTAEKRALDQLSTASGKLAVVAADQRGSLRSAMEKAGRPAEIDALRAFKLDLISALAPAASAVLLDPEIALPHVLDGGAVPRDVGVLVAVERSGAPAGDDGLRPAGLLPDFGAAGVRRVGGTAAKLLVYLRPDREDLDGHNARLVREVADDCAAHDLLLVVEGLTYRLADEPAEQFAARRPALTRDLAQLLEACGAKYLKLGYPGSAVACGAITDAVATPWALLSAGVDHATFVGQLRDALDGGGSGFIAGRSIWKEAIAMDEPDRRAFLRGEGRRRVEELVEQVEQR